MCEPVAYLDVEPEQALRMAEAGKALGDPARPQLVDVLRKHAGKICLRAHPLLDIAQPALSHHLKKLRDAGLVDAERRGFVGVLPRRAEALDELASWLHS